MRLIGIIPHPYLVISIFRNDQRISIKLENELYEQTYKLGDDERFANIEAVHQFVDGQFLEDITRIFIQMHTARNGTMGRLAGPESAGPEMEEII